jgi:small subunit ribosomal protein S9
LAQEGVYGAVGRRKTSIARVRIVAGSGDILVNRKPINDYFGRESLKTDVARALELTNTSDKVNVVANVNGGGSSSQAGAIRHGIARALVEMDPSMRAVLKKAGLLKRDPRMKERKKYGQRGARARFQFSKR